MDTPRSHNPVTFMSNMLYACSVLYRMGLPFLLVLNKVMFFMCFYYYKIYMFTNVILGNAIIFI